MAEEDEIHKRLASDMQQFELFDAPSRDVRIPTDDVDEDPNILRAVPPKAEKKEVELGEGEDVEYMDDPTLAYIHAGQTGAGVADQQASREGDVPEKILDIPAVAPVEPIEAVELSAIVEPSAAVPRPEVAPAARGVGIEAELEGEFIHPSIPRFGIRPAFAAKLEVEPTEIPSGVVPVLAEAAVEAPALMPVRATIEPASADEDALIQLDIQLSQYGVGETVSIIISNLPEGAVLSAGTLQDDGSWLLEAKDLAGLTMSMPENVSGVFNLYVEVITQTELSTPVSNYYSLPVDIEPVADQPSLQVSLTDNYDGSYSLVIDAALQDVDGSEVLAIGLRGVPPLTIVRDGTNVVIVGEDGSVDLTGFDLSNISLFSPEEQTSFSFYIYAQAIDEADVAEVMQQMDIYVNQEPEDLTFAQVTLGEDATSGALVGQAAAIDPNAHEGDVVSYSLSADTPDIFIIDPNTGQVFLADGAVLDFETEPSYAITVVATDTYGGTTSRSFVVDVSDVPEAPTDITLDNLSVFENDKGAVIGNISALDEDVGDTATYSVSDPRFIVSAGRLKLAPGEILDFETEPQVSIDVTVTDSAGLSYTETFTIDVINESEAPTDIIIDNLSVDEATDGAVVGNISVVDEDVGDTHTFTVSDDRFEVVDGELKLVDGVSLDFEGDKDIRINVTATDEAGDSYNERFVVTVNDINEPPVDIELANDSVDENAAGAVVGALSVVDPDAGDTHTYVVSDARFEVVNGELKLVDGVSLDFEAEPSINIDVTATDENGLSFTETMTVNVLDTGDAPTDIIIDNLSVMENDAGAVIGNVSVVDPDVGDSFSYVVSDPRFSVTKGQLILGNKEA
ncbi:MAG: cadherin domain-containing protein, partial [Sphingomonadales bacterium]|nr:cadherin domain-containing protein [Sphingomonadales bacterium]